MSMAEVRLALEEIALALDCALAAGERLAGHQGTFRAVVTVGHHADPHSAPVYAETLTRDVAPLRAVALTRRQPDLRFRHRGTHEPQRRNRAHVRQRLDRYAPCNGVAVHRC